MHFVRFALIAWALMLVAMILGANLASAEDCYRLDSAFEMAEEQGATSPAYVRSKYYDTLVKVYNLISETGPVNRDDVEVFYSSRLTDGNVVFLAYDKTGCFLIWMRLPYELAIEVIGQGV